MPSADYYKKSNVQAWKNGLMLDTSKTYQDIDEDKFKAYAAQKYGEGTDFYDQAINAYNAYKSKTWNPNIWQAGSMNLLGDDSAFQSWQNDRLSMFEDALSRIGDASHQEQYNSAGAQAARLREAGLNPDLTGGVEAGEAGDLDNLEAARAPINPGNAALQDVASFSQSLLQTTLGVYSSLQGIMGVSADLRAKDLQVTGLLTNDAWDIIKDATGEFINNGLAYSGSKGAEFNADSILNEDRQLLLESILSRVDKLPYSKRNRGKIKSLIRPLIFAEDKEGMSAFTLRYENMINDLVSTTYSSRNNLSQKSGLLGALPSGKLGTDQEALRFIGRNVFKPIQDLLLDTQKSDLDFKKRYNDEALKEGLPELKVGSEASEYMLQKENKVFRAKLNKTFNDIRYKITHATNLSPAWQLSIEAGLLSAQALALGRLGM